MRRAEPVHHPSEDILVQHAAGQLDLAHRVLTEAHLDFCPSCRATQAEMIEPGRRWLEEHPVVAPKPTLWQGLVDRLEAEERAGDSLAALGDVPLPVTARGELPGGEKATGQPRWRSIPLSTARFAILHYERDTATALLTLRLAGGKRLPRHRHEGCEDLVVLTGAFRDRQGHFVAGDYQHSDAGSVHGPRVDPGEVCWIVTRIERGVRFAGLRGLVQRLSGL